MQNAQVLKSKVQKDQNWRFLRKIGAHTFVKLVLLYVVWEWNKKKVIAQYISRMESEEKKCLEGIPKKLHFCM